MKNRRNNKFHILNRLSGVQKILFCIALSIFSSVIYYFNSPEIIPCIMFGWNIFCFSMIVISWIIFFTTSRDQLQFLAKKQDESLPVIFALVVFLVCFSLFGSLLLMKKDFFSDGAELSRAISLLVVGFSWILLHTIFTIRYAHKYYDKSKNDSNVHFGGLDFPNESEPDYVDFAYFSFVIGMTFQVSDIIITSGTLRRLVLIHSLISFAFNAIIVALTISIIANLK